MLIVGLTGGIATGKSTVSALLSTKYSLPVLDADILARKAVEPGSPGLTLILQTFGEDLAAKDDNGNIIGLNRIELGKRVFNGPNKHTDIEKLNGIIHPIVKRMMVKWILKEWIKGS